MSLQPRKKQNSFAPKIEQKGGVLCVFKKEIVLFLFGIRKSFIWYSEQYQIKNMQIPEA